MEQEILNKIRIDYNNSLKRRTKYADILKQLKELEKDEKIKKYIDLKNRLEQFNYEKIINESDEEILSRTFWAYQYAINETNEIYLYIGTFKLDSHCDIEHGPGDIRLKRNDPRAEFRQYRNIEDGYSEEIPINKCEEFEKTHTIIFPEIEDMADKYFYEIQKEYIKIAVAEGQEVACKKILTKTKSN